MLHINNKRKTVSDRMRRGGKSNNTRTLEAESLRSKNLKLPPHIELVSKLP